MEVEPKVDINKRTKLTASALTAVLVVGSMGLTAASASAAPQVDPDLNYCMEHRRPFGDVDSSTPHATDIQWMYCNAITTGFRDPGSYPATYSYRGMDTVIRQDMAAFMHRTSDVIANVNESDYPTPPSAFNLDFEATYRYDSGKKFLYQMTDSWVDYKNKYGYKEDKPQLHLVFKITNTGTTTANPFFIGIKSFQDKIQTDREYIYFSNEIQPGGVTKNCEIILELNDLDSYAQLIVEDSSYLFTGTTVVDNLYPSALLASDSKKA